MSIKRSREVSRRPRDAGDFESKKAPERVYKWEDDVSPRLSEPFQAYGAAFKYAKDSLVEHTVFGKGIVTKVDGGKIEVLFQAGLKKLAQNAAGKEAPKAEPKAEGAAAVPAAAPAIETASAQAPETTPAAEAPAAEPAKV
ncbi:MAG: hypothetical protein QM765_19880 [Myxococcales bacterium]